MSEQVKLWDWEKAVLRQLFYMAPDGDSDFQSLTEAAERAVGHRAIHPDKLQGLARKFVSLGYGQGIIKDIQIPSIDIEFKLNRLGYESATSLVKNVEYVSPLGHFSRVNWSMVAAIISAIAAIISAVIAYRALK